jgi:hypothetical protein
MKATHDDTRRILRTLSYRNPTLRKPSAQNSGNIGLLQPHEQRSGDVAAAIRHVAIRVMRLGDLCIGGELAA